MLDIIKLDGSLSEVNIFPDKIIFKSHGTNYHEQCENLLKHNNVGGFNITVDKRFSLNMIVRGRIVEFIRKEEAGIGSEEFTIRIEE